MWALQKKLLSYLGIRSVFSATKEENLGSSGRQIVLKNCLLVQDADIEIIT